MLMGWLWPFVLAFLPVEVAKDHFVICSDNKYISCPKCGGTLSDDLVCNSWVILEWGVKQSLDLDTKSFVQGPGRLSVWRGQKACLQHKSW